MDGTVIINPYVWPRGIFARDGKKRPNSHSQRRRDAQHSSHDRKTYIMLVSWSPRNGLPPFCYITDALVKFNRRSFRRFVLRTRYLATDEISDRHKSRLSLSYDASRRSRRETLGNPLFGPLEHDQRKQFACMYEFEWNAGSVISLWLEPVKSNYSRYL
mgnify:CR=1 FL=1